MTFPPSLNGFHATSIAKRTSEIWVIGVIGNQILTPVNTKLGAHPFIDSKVARGLEPLCEAKITLGQWQGLDCEVWQLKDDAKALTGFTLVVLRELLKQSSEEVFSLASRAVQLLHWQATHKFCGRCGKANQLDIKEHSLFCADCSINNYPRISPCIIVVVTRGDRCLLARNANWPEGRFSALAGFLEAGESAEQGLRREVFEEVGIELENIRYIASQSWPYPGQLMLGFLAEAKTEEFVVDGEEIVEANWYRWDQLPTNTSPSGIIAGDLIRHFASQAALTYGES